MREIILKNCIWPESLIAMSKKVLVIAEGANDKKIIGRIFSAYEKNIEVFTFKMDVYQLFAIYDKQGADFSELDIQNTLINELKLTPKERDILLNKYVDIFLILFLKSVTDWQYSRSFVEVFAFSTSSASGERGLTII